MITNRTFLGKALRLPLKLIPSNSVLPILSGKLRGKRWIKGSGVAGFWLGCYESDKQKRFTQAVKPNMIVYDIGANVGFYTLLAAELTKPDGHVFSFEPVPRNVGFLHRHLILNHVENATVFSAAVGRSRGETTFHVPANDFFTGKISPEGNLCVQVLKLDDLCFHKEIFPPNLIKIDVEGAEYDVLCGAEETLRAFMPTIFLATHSPEVHRRCCAFLVQLGYKLHSLTDKPLSETDEVLAVPSKERSALDFSI
ncbi:MAG: FkbM family methyltransferase [bacterium]